MSDEEESCLPEGKSKTLDQIMHRIIEIENLDKNDRGLQHLNKEITYANGYILSSDEMSNKKGDLICWRSLSKQDLNKNRQRSKTPTIDAILAQASSGTLIQISAAASSTSKPKKSNNFAEFQPVRNPKTTCYDKVTNEKMQFLLKKMQQDLNKSDKDGSKYSNKSVDSVVNQIVEKLSLGDSGSQSKNKDNPTKGQFVSPNSNLKSSLKKPKPSAPKDEGFSDVPSSDKERSSPDIAIIKQKQAVNTTRKSDSPLKLKNSDHGDSSIESDEEKCVLDPDIMNELELVETMIKKDEQKYLKNKKNRSNSRRSREDDTYGSLSSSSFGFSSQNDDLKRRDRLKKRFQRSRSRSKPGTNNSSSSNKSAFDRLRDRRQKRRESRESRRKRSRSESLKRPIEKMREKNNERRLRRESKKANRSRSTSDSLKRPVERMRPKSNERKARNESKRTSRSRSRSESLKRPVEKIRQKSNERKQKREMQQKRMAKGSSENVPRPEPQMKRLNNRFNTIIDKTNSKFTKKPEQNKNSGQPKANPKFPKYTGKTTVMIEKINNKMKTVKG
jgi:hypothetical protein